MSAAEHIEQVTINCNGWDDIPLLQCEREECMVTSDDIMFKGARVYWTADIYGLTPEQVVEVRDKHLAESEAT